MDQYFSRSGGVSAVYQLKWHCHGTIAFLTICPTASLKLYDSWLSFWFRLGVLQVLHPAPRKNSIYICNINSLLVLWLPARFYQWAAPARNQGDGGQRLRYQFLGVLLCWAAMGQLYLSTKGPGSHQVALPIQVQLTY